MSLLCMFIGLPSALIGLRIFKKEFQIRTGGVGIVFDEDNHVAACLRDPAPKVVIALGRIGRQRTPFAQHLG